MRSANAKAAGQRRDGFVEFVGEMTGESLRV
jgi:hypothetical protein